jgi:hypothetical protein
MRQYLSSFRTGAHPDRLVALAGNGRRTALIPNALDGLPADVRETGLRRDLDDLHAAGLDVTLIDLREPAAVPSLATYDIVWVRGGNVSCCAGFWPTRALTLSCAICCFVTRSFTAATAPVPASWPLT